MRHFCRSVLFTLCSLFFSVSLCLCGEVSGLRVPEGFEVTEFADSKLANDVYTLTIDPKGRVVVSGRGYVRILVDDDGDGRADRAIDFADGPKDGAMGMLWEGPTLYVTGDGGLRRYEDRDGDGKADGPSTLIRKLKTGGEHDAHAVRRGPDGWLYVLCGNNTGIDASFAQLPTSPVAKPVAGCVIRFTPDLKHSEIVADGFRNPYDMDFNPDGELFTFDSDNERCVSLPWYEFTRVYHVIPGGHHGWQSPQRGQFWRMPPYFLDVVAPVAALGRGSPTGVACYRHAQFPEEYRGGLFVADWTFGVIHFLKLQRSGASYTSKPRVFLEATGENGFAPTGLVVHPATGDLYVSIGGRGTRGAVYRVRYPKGVRKFTEEEIARMQPRPRSLDWRDGAVGELLRQATEGDAPARLRALQAVRRHRERPKDDVLLRAVTANWDHPDRSVRQEAARLVATLDAPLLRDLAADADTPVRRTTFGLGRFAADPKSALESASEVAAVPDNPVSIRLGAVRLAQLALGGLTEGKYKGHVWEGYTPRDPRAGQVGAPLAALRAAFPSGDADLDRELSRTLAMLEDDAPALLRQVADRLAADSDPLEDIHYLIVLSRLRAERPALVTTRAADALLALDRKFTDKRLNRDRHWPLRVAELHAELARKGPGLNAALLAHKEFGRPDHALFARGPGFDRKRAAEVFLARAEKETEYPWNADLVALLGELPPERGLPLLARLWGKAGLDDAILPLLARHARPEDRDKFLDGLSSPQLASVRLCLEALEHMPPRQDGPEALALVRALRRLPDGKEENVARERLVMYLRGATGQEKLAADKEAWADWFRKAHPGLAAKLGGDDGVDVEGWNKRLAAVDWAAGDAERGRKMFTAAGCASCHSGGQAMGPDLAGVTGRFSRQDLFTAIVQPSRDVSPRYRTTLLNTEDGKVYQGLIVYEAVDSLILQTGPAETIRLTNKQVSERRVTPTSLMPAGALDQLADRDVADLYAYLRTLGAAVKHRRRARRTAGGLPRAKGPRP